MPTTQELYSQCINIVAFAPNVIIQAGSSRWRLGAGSADSRGRGPVSVSPSNAPPSSIGLCRRPGPAKGAHVWVGCEPVRSPVRSLLGQWDTFWGCLPVHEQSPASGWQKRGREKMSQGFDVLVQQVKVPSRGWRRVWMDLEGLIDALSQFPAGSVRICLGQETPTLISQGMDFLCQVTCVHGCHKLDPRRMRQWLFVEGWG